MRKMWGGLSGARVLESTRQYLQALQQSAFTRISTSKIHGSKKCPASTNQTGSHGWKMACNEPLMTVSIPRQWLGRGATVVAGYQSVGPINKYQGGWQPPTGYPPYVPRNQAEYGHHLVVMPNNKVHGQVGRIQPGAPGVWQHTAEREQKAEMFWAK